MRSTGTLILTLLAACGDAPAAAPASRPAAPRAEQVDAAVTEAQALGRELFGIMDRVMAYRSSHFNNLPKDLPTAGIDSLTRTTIRRLSIAGGVPTIAVIYRARDGHALQGCSATSKVLEDSMLNGGAYEVHCTLRSGESQAFTVGG
jgi:hypothetical protein